MTRLSSILLLGSVAIGVAACSQPPPQTAAGPTTQPADADARPARARIIPPTHHHTAPARDQRY